MIMKDVVPRKSNINKTFREFSNERTRVERRENFRKLRIKENFYRAIDGYFDWISTAGSPKLPAYITTVTRTSSQSLYFIARIQ